MMSHSPLELVIAGGPQQGARLLLAEGLDVRIGSAFDNDVVLRDPTIPAYAALLHVTSDNCQWHAIDEALDSDVGGLPLTLNEAVSVTNGTSVRLGSTVLSVLAEPDSIDAENISVQGHKKAKTVKKSLARRLRSSVLFIVVPLLALTGVAAASLWQRSASTEAAAPPSITSLLAASAFRELEVDTTAGTVLVKGFVETQREKLQLAELLKEASQPLQLEITVGEQLARAVEDVYRTNGVDVEVKAIGAATVEVRTSVKDASQLDALEKVLRADLPQVSVLKLINMPPKQNNSIPDSPTRELPIDPGKRVAMVVSTEPAYLLTEDGSRYFVGSLLPGGQQISEIDKGRVLLEQNGQKTELEF